MKAFFATIAFLVMFILIQSIITLRLDNGKVIAKNTIETTDGNIWEYETNIPVGTKVHVLFNDCDTPNRTDDIVTGVWE